MDFGLVTGHWVLVINSSRLPNAQCPMPHAQFLIYGLTITTP
ncbi:hypothetical protein [Nostoc sp.]